MDPGRERRGCGARHAAGSPLHNEGQRRVFVAYGGMDIAGMAPVCGGFAVGRLQWGVGASMVSEDAERWDAGSSCVMCRAVGSIRVVETRFLAVQEHNPVHVIAVR